MSTMYLSNITEMDRALQHPGLVPANPWCLDSYRFYLFLIVVPLSCLEPKELGIIQATLGITRFTIIVSIILYCLAKLAESPLIEHTIPSFKIHLQLEWTHHQHHMLQSPALPSQLCSGFQCGGLGPLHPCVHLCPDAPPWHPQPHPPHQAEEGAPLVHGSHGVCMCVCEELMI